MSATQGNIRVTRCRRRCRGACNLRVTLKARLARWALWALWKPPSFWKKKKKKVKSFGSPRRHMSGAQQHTGDNVRRGGQLDKKKKKMKEHELNSSRYTLLSSFVQLQPLLIQFIYQWLGSVPCFQRDWDHFFSLERYRNDACTSEYIQTDWAELGNP
jgi:hypothetical protein